LEHLLAAWTKVARQLKEAKHVIVLTDYDGTLTPIVERPELAHLSEDTRKVLRSLANQKQFTVGVMSGRSLSDLKDKVRVSNVVYAGNHGMEMEGPGLRYVNPAAEELSPVLKLIHLVLSRALGAIPGVLVEDKGLTLSVHYRMAAPERVAEVKGAVEQAVGTAQAAGKVRLTAGKMVYEIRPAVEWDKGKALKLLIEKYGRRDKTAAVVYLGDDRTDEDAFKAVEEYGNGVSVFVGEEKAGSFARYFLRSPAEVISLLGGLPGIAPRGH